MTSLALALALLVFFTVMAWAWREADKTPDQEHFR